MHRISTLVMSAHYLGLPEKGTSFAVTTTLFTFLGRVPRDEGIYRTTRYDFGDGAPTDPVAFFGWPLSRRLGPDRLVVLGTAGSMWDHLSEVDLDFGDDFAEERDVLIDATTNKDVREEYLEWREPLLAKQYGIDVRLRLMPYCRTESEQVEILRLLSEHVDTGDRVHIDITHGFRTLPLLSVLAALYLRRVRGADIAGIWYGFYDEDAQAAPVYDMSGLLHLADWLEALAIYDRSGDYGVFSDLVGPDGRLLRQAAFFERTSNPVKAREALSGWASRGNYRPAGDAAAALFQDELTKRVSWRSGRDRAAWESSLSRIYLDKRDYLRAAIFALESAIPTQALYRNLDPRNTSDRKQLRDEMTSNSEEFDTLNKLRNSLAHGSISRPQKVTKALGAGGEP